MTQFRHDQLTVFGVGAELREAEWRGVVRQLLAQGLVTGKYGPGRNRPGDFRRYTGPFSAKNRLLSNPRTEGVGT